MPRDPAELINFTDDASRLVADPLLPPATSITLPRWLPGSGAFADGSATILQVFERLVETYARPAQGSPLIGSGDPAKAPPDDILGRPRTDGAPDRGAYELSVSAIFTDGFESGDLRRWRSFPPPPLP